MSSFKLTYNVKQLHLQHVFTISRGSKASVENVFVQIERDGIIGLGEAAPNKRYGETADLVTRQLEAFDSSLFDRIEKYPHEIEELLDVSSIELCPSVRVALEMSWLDWWGKSQRQPLWKLLGLKGNQTPVTSYTIGIDSLDILKKKVIDAEPYPILKVKLGTVKDREIIETIRSVSQKPIRIDANEGWTSIDQAKREIEYLATQNIEMIEQPMPSSMDEVTSKLKEFSPIPLCADESFTGTEHLEEIAQAFDCINIKLMKVGSVLKAIRLLKQAHDLGLKVMIGCMIESSLAISAGALVGTEADFVDLDGHLLIKDDPFEGARLSGDYQLVLEGSSGLGVAAL